MIIKLGKGAAKPTIDRTAPIKPMDPERLLALGVRSTLSREVGVGVMATVVEDEQGEVCPGMRLFCDRCRARVDVVGQTGRAVRRGLAQLRETCPMQERNFYVTVPPEEAEDDPADDEMRPLPGWRPAPVPPTRAPRRGGSSANMPPKRMGGSGKGPPSTPPKGGGSPPRPNSGTRSPAQRTENGIAGKKFSIVFGKS